MVPETPDNPWPLTRVPGSSSTTGERALRFDWDKDLTHAHNREAIRDLVDWIMFNVDNWPVSHRERDNARALEASVFESASKTYFVSMKSTRKKKMDKLERLAHDSTPTTPSTLASASISASPTGPAMPERNTLRSRRVTLAKQVRSARLKMEAYRGDQWQLLDEIFMQRNEELSKEGQRRWIVDSWMSETVSNLHRMKRHY